MLSQHEGLSSLDTNMNYELIEVLVFGNRTNKYFNFDFSILLFIVGVNKRGNYLSTESTICSTFSDTFSKSSSMISADSLI